MHANANFNMIRKFYFEHILSQKYSDQIKCSLHSFHAFMLQRDNNDQDFVFYTWF